MFTLLHSLGRYMDVMLPEQAEQVLQFQANHQASAHANCDMLHLQHAQATHRGDQVAAGLAQVHKQYYLLLQKCQAMQHAIADSMKTFGCEPHLALAPIAAHSHGL